MKSQYYIEYYTMGDENELPEADTFGIQSKYLTSFLRRLQKAGRRIVYLREMDGKGRELLNKRNVQFGDQCVGGNYHV